MQKCHDKFFTNHPPIEDASYRIVLTQPLGDQDFDMTRRIDRTMRRLYGEDLGSVIDLVLLPCPAILPSEGQASERISQGKANALSLMERAHADVVIWGELLSAISVEIRFAHARTPQQGDYKSATEKGAVLEGRFGEDLGALIAVSAPLQSETTREQQGAYLGNRMERVFGITSSLTSPVPAGLTLNARGQLWFAHGSAAYWVGLQRGNNTALKEAVTAYRAALEERTRDRVPLDWARTQNNLGNALSTLGERESGTARLEEAVTAYRAALEELTRDSFPLYWAMTQNNLGNALQILGERESGTARLELAVTGYRDALEEWTRDRVPLDWARTQNNLGTALQTLGERESGTARLELAVTAFRAALEEWTRDRVPLDWARTQNNLGIALGSLGERESSTTRLEQAVAAYHAALEERTRDRVPLDWAGTQMNLGNALRTLGARESGTARLEEAITAYRDALEERTRDRVPLDWAATQNNLAILHQSWAEKVTGAERASQLQRALGHVEAALEVYSPDQSAHYHNNATALRADILSALNE